MNYSQYSALEQIEPIEQLFLRTFSDSESEQEGKVIANLVRDFLATTAKEDIFVFVAKNQEQIVGSIILTRLTYPNTDNIFLLSPVAIHTDFQGKGIGQALIKFGLETLQKLDVELVMTYGDINFYAKTGFIAVSEAIIQAPLAMTYPDAWLANMLDGSAIRAIKGKPTCVDAINVAAYW